MPTEPQVRNFEPERVVRDVQEEFRLFRRKGHAAVEAAGESHTNGATPENLAKLVEQLETLTDEIIGKRLSITLPDAGVLSWEGDLGKWKGRLEGYREAVDAAAPGDRRAVLWTVTAPLLLGFFGGPDSKLPQQVADVATPYILANALAVDEDWASKRLELLWEDLKENAKGLAWDAGKILIGVGVVAIAVALLLRSR